MILHPVNTNPLESVTNYMNQADIDEYLEEIYFRGVAVNISTDENFVSKITQSRFGTELWKLFLIIALIIAIIEMMIARSTKKDLAGIK